MARQEMRCRIANYRVQAYNQSRNAKKEWQDDDNRIFGRRFNGIQLRGG
ncbi:MAG: hypothetical protein K0Q59_4438 [Paenibacillus sp.]|nr:hypothetical protein [Paenibacillus sp.]